MRIPIGSERRAASELPFRLDESMNRSWKNSLLIFLGLIFLNCLCVPVAAEEPCPGVEKWRVEHGAQFRGQSNQRVAGTVADERLRAELLSMARADQAVRRRLTDPFDMMAAGEMVAIDSRNAGRLRAIISEAGFPRASDVGFDGVGSAWLIVQHAANDPQLQKFVLSQIGPMVAAGELSGEQYALLFDRVRLQEKNAKQLFGTQLYPGDGAVPFPIEDEANVDLRRMAVGMMPLADYRCLHLARRLHGSASDGKP